MIKISLSLHKRKTIAYFARKRKITKRICFASEIREKKVFLVRRLLKYPEFHSYFLSILKDNLELQKI